jgi:hypothetical protein
LFLGVMDSIGFFATLTQRIVGCSAAD